MIIKVENLGKKYKTGDTYSWALNNANLEINKGEIVTILGPSGSGKSTLLNIIGGIDKSDNGRVQVENKDITKLNDKQLVEYRRDNIGFVFQFFNLIPNLTVRENVETATNLSRNPLNISEVLTAVGMYEKRNKFPSELSGGEQQRVSIARAIAKNPSILLCDEPTGALDFKTARDILKLIEEINQKYNTTIIIVTHNTPISLMSDRIIRVRSGEIIECKINSEKITAEGVEW